MATSKVYYRGELRTTCVHLSSGNEIITDAPVDNRGKGEAFSPTDLLATSIASCMLTIMGIKANDLKIDIEGAGAEVNKIMASNPRRVAKVQITVQMPEGNYPDEIRRKLERSAMECPVIYSIHPDIDKEVDFQWT